jgi:hypothetical protein
MLDTYDELVRTIPLGDWAADEDAKPRALLFVPAGRVFTVESVLMSTEAAVVDQDTDYNTFYVQNNVATYLAAAVICSLANGPAAGGVTIAIAPTAMSTPAATKKVVNGGAAGATIYFVSVLTGAGLAVPSLVVHLVGQWA